VGPPKGPAYPIEHAFGANAREEEKIAWALPPPLQKLGPFPKPGLTIKEEIWRRSPASFLREKGDL